MNGLASSLGVMQIVGLKVSEAAMMAIVEQMKCTDDVRSWLAATMSSTLKATIKAMLTAMAEAGADVPQDIVPKDYISYAEVEQIVSQILTMLVGQKASAVETANELARLSEKAFGKTKVLGLQLKAMEEFYEAASRTEAKQVANQLFERHLKLVH